MRCCAVSQCFTFVSFLFFFLTTMMLPLDLPEMFAIFGLLKEAKALPPPPKTTAVPCSGCIKTFPNKGALARHYQANPLHDVRPTAARPYQCETCKRTFPDQGRLAKHVVRFHSAWPRPNQAAIEDKSVPASTPALQVTVEEVEPVEDDTSEESVSVVKPKPKPYSTASNKRTKKRKGRRENECNEEPHVSNGLE